LTAAGLLETSIARSGVGRPAKTYRAAPELAAIEFPAHRYEDLVGLPPDGRPPPVGRGTPSGPPPPAAPPSTASAPPSAADSRRRRSCGRAAAWTTSAPDC